MLGDHIAQRGSLVAPDRLRFDFVHQKPISPDELARVEDIAQWYISRFLSMRAGAFADPASHFHHYSTLTDEQAVFAARDIWHSINRPNLIENILPTRPRATLVLRKDADHSINRLRLRKL